MHGLWMRDLTSHTVCITLTIEKKKALAEFPQHLPLQKALADGWTHCCASSQVAPNNGPAVRINYRSDHRGRPSVAWPPPLAPLRRGPRLRAQPQGPGMLLRIRDAAIVWGMGGTSARRSMEEVYLAEFREQKKASRDKIKHVVIKN